MVIIQLKVSVVVHSIHTCKQVCLPEGKHVNYMCRMDVCKDYDIHIFHANIGEGRFVEHVEILLKKDRPAWL